ncbi:malto-oligosyltrehalose synthase [Gulosibacter sp. ACHW.36C]|uniref:Malto-oligosyltrehalose synthase n=1 Tax=Gulosibacter sediminis TaxID=1729695 RepID=A0ABY4N091_9MICO|nr:malto-oligosyltrehalose synthase [Gulosibacter sediminis]UQN15449.1 malto-oligosyltrehalose synthase [Gulosibacter sediminis]
MRTPASTYRLQLSSEFTLDDAARLVPYFVDLGVDWLYLSPILQSTEGSTHGYDVVDPSRVDEARGGREALVRLAEAAHEAGLGILVDIVPNHVGVAVPRQNPWWWDVLQHGKGSRYAHFFDIDWPAGGGKLLLPVIGDADMPTEPGAPINGMSVDREAGVLRYYDHEYPLAPGSADDESLGVRTVHDAQHYALVHWRRGDWSLNYRRFFTVTELAGVRVEEPEVWDAAHAEILSWVREGLVDGLRIDHVDGLRDPRGYLQRLREHANVYISVEKILEPGDQLQPWPIDGTTGYDALGEFERVLVDDEGRDDLDEQSASLSHEDVDDWQTLVHGAKRFVTDGPLHAEVRRVARDLDGVAEPDERTVDAISEIAACFGVYRTYLPDGVEHLEQAARDAADWRSDLADAIERVLGKLRDPANEGALRFQQTSGMIMAKAVEDRSFYRYSRLTSLNEVGGDPSVFAYSPERFHELQAERQDRWPHAQTALTTHDTKRSEDVRARLDALSEHPELWRDSLEQLLEIAPISNPAFGNLLWQAIIGVWPASRERLYAYAEKAAREAGDHTTWTEINSGYEEELRAAIDAAFDHPAARAIVANLIEELRQPGWSNSLSMKALQLLGPGVPDVYQGTELWQHSLVDPDNRRPVPWLEQTAALSAILRGARPAFDESDLTGSVKLLLTVIGLRLRKGLPDRFTEYRPLHAHGASADHLIAVDRGGVVVLATRLPIDLERGGGWHDTRLQLPEGRWVDQIDGITYEGEVGVAHLLKHWPVAMLARSDREEQ